MLQFGGLDEMLKIKTIPYVKIFAPLLVVNFIVVFIVIWLQPSLPPEVPLLYGRAYGEKQLIAKLGLTIPSGVVIFATLVNAAVSSLVSEKLLQQILVATSIVATILSLITTTKIILLVGNV